MEALLNPDNMGCGHIKLTMKVGFSTLRLSQAI